MDFVATVGIVVANAPLLLWLETFVANAVGQCEISQLLINQRKMPELLGVHTGFGPFVAPIPKECTAGSDTLICFEIWVELPRQVPFGNRKGEPTGFSPLGIVGCRRVKLVVGMHRDQLKARPVTIAELRPLSTCKFSPLMNAAASLPMKASEGAMSDATAIRPLPWTPTAQSIAS